MAIENVIKHIIDHHNQRGNDTHHRYWHTKLETVDSDAARQIIDQLDHSQHHIGDAYRQNGMRIDLNRETPEANNILKVINFILVGLANNEGKEDKAIEVDEELFLSEDISALNVVDDYESELLQYKQIYGHNGKKSRTLTEMELPEEIDIKAIAVSILAETNGSVKMAREILTVAGLKIIKQMNIGELQHLRGDLQSISTKDGNAQR